MKHTPPRVKLLAIDLDGTLLAPDKSLSAANLEAVHRARDAGVLVVLVSARPPFGIVPFSHRLGLDGAVIAYNGAFGIDVGREQVFLDRPLARRDGQGLVEVARRYDLYAGYYAAMEWFVERVCREMEWEAVSLKRRPKVVRDLTDNSLPRPHKLIVIELGEPQKLAECYSDIRAVLPHVNAHFSGEHALEISDQHASKGIALALLAESMGLDREQVAAIGDGENDLSMLQFAGVGVAVANAPVAVRDAADFVVASNEDSGVAEAIHRLLSEHRG
jgi:Cof subfamily protein (haloacid dehalogenase superfamily)